MSDKSTRMPLYYTFGNHMHWVDMEWLWGYFVLPASVRDMLHFCKETSTKGQVNFDAVGYEKMAVEAPEALQELRAAIATGTIEVSGGSYGQPYGLFHGGESNVRQRIYGARTVRRLLGVWPRTFWEEEFDFFPQLPQMLVGAGFAYGSLFFQWTWHTPIVPVEDAPAVWWEGQDGSTLLVSARNALNLHQWPEDFAGLLEGPAPRMMPAAGIVQWLELMPSPDWMCRSEVLLPQMKSLLANPDYEVIPATLPEYLDVARPHAVTRRYTMGDVFHGMSLGKNGDLFRRLSRSGEQTLLAAEAVATTASFMGRPYAQWNAYPVWELEEAWRDLLIAQHHDNDECEGLMGHLGRRHYERSGATSSYVVTRTVDLLARRATRGNEEALVFNPVGWSRNAAVTVGSRHGIVRDLPPCGYRVVSPADLETNLADVVLTADSVFLRRADVTVEIDRMRGVIRQISTPARLDGILDSCVGIGDIAMVRDGVPETFQKIEIERLNDAAGPSIRIHRTGRAGAKVVLTVSIPHDLTAVDVHLEATGLPRPDGRVSAALRTGFALAGGNETIVHDHPYGVSSIAPTGTHLRKYPTGDWMTSPQVFEEVDRPFTGLQFIDALGERGNLLYLHDGSQAFQRLDDRIVNVLSMYDPWDERYFVDRLDARVRLVPHEGMTNSERWALAQEFTRPPICGDRSLKPALAPVGGMEPLSDTGRSSDLPGVFGPIWLVGAGTRITAIFRETAEAGEHLDWYAGGGLDHPTVVRLVEFDGGASPAVLQIAGEVGSARIATVRGDRLSDLVVSPCAPPAGMDAPVVWSSVTVTLKPFEIATIYLDPVLARRVSRNLDEHRGIWATVHRVGHTD